ncbi:uncharacterized protein LOC122262383 [Penaeus japonicus]|uniref:uncharacterized protein LOC122262383 n=1 Tax=Penaeus japonicus TaxID=27405 RepID=UPI001C70B410|nr:uncharacterized protein LOC122262383 [Penaeus japonicus]
MYINIHICIYIKTYIYIIAAALECTGDEVACGSAERCVPYRYICDSDSDCSDASDEDPDLCWAWNNSECERGSAQCLTNGQAECVPIETYCHRTQPVCSGSLNRRVCSVSQYGTNILISFIFTLIRSARTGKFGAPASIKFIPDNEPVCGHSGFFSSDVSLTTGIKPVIVLTVISKNLPSSIQNSLVNHTIQANEVTVLMHTTGAFSLGAELRTNLNNTLSHQTVLTSPAEITSDFWLGGRYELDDLSWMYDDGTPMPQGTPFWSLRRYHHCDTRNRGSVREPYQVREANNGRCYHYTQAPEDPPRGFCAAITYGKHFYMSDEDCLADMSPLCVTSV